MKLAGKYFKENYKRLERLDTVNHTTNKGKTQFLSGLDTIETVLALHAFGLNVIPTVPQSKMPSFFHDIKNKSGLFFPSGIFEITRATQLPIDLLIQLFAPFKSTSGELIYPNIRLNLGTRDGIHIMAIDTDTHDSFEDIEKELLAASIPHLSYKSSKGGQFLLRVNKPVQNKKENSLCIGIRFENQYSIIPPSLHPTGTPYRWVSDDLTALNEIVDVDYLAKELSHLVVIEGKNTVTTKKKKIIANGANDGNRNNTLFEVLRDLYNRGLSENELQKQALEFADNCTPPMPRNEVMSTLRSVLSKPPKLKKSATTWRYVWGFILNHDWNKRTQITDIHVLEAMARLQIFAGEKQFAASVRAIAKLMRIPKSEKTVSTAIKRLCGVGIVKLVRRKKLSGYMYEFTDEIKQYGLGDPPSHDTPTIEEQNVFWSRRNAYTIWKFLQDNPTQSQSSICEHTGIAKATVSNNIQWLLEHELIAHGDNGYIAIDDTDMDDIAVTIGNNRKIQLQNERHDKDRAKWLHTIIMQWKNQYAMECDYQIKNICSETTHMYSVFYTLRVYMCSYRTHSQLPDIPTEPAITENPVTVQNPQNGIPTSQPIEKTTVGNSDSTQTAMVENPVTVQNPDTGIPTSPHVQKSRVGNFDSQQTAMVEKTVAVQNPDCVPTIEELQKSDVPDEMATVKNSDVSHRTVTQKKSVVQKKPVPQSVQKTLAKMKLSDAASIERWEVRKVQIARHFEEQRKKMAMSEKSGMPKIPFF